MGLNAVFIIESPSAKDIYERRAEGDPICQIVTLNGLSCESRCTIDRAALERAIAEYTGQVAAHPDIPPVLHISAHGCETGFGLSNDDEVPWSELLDLLRTANNLATDGIILCISCCHGSSAVSHLPDTVSPNFLYLITNKDSPTWSETAVGFTTFYHYLAQEKSVESAVEAMKASSLNENFVLKSPSNNVARTTIASTGTRNG